MYIRLSFFKIITLTAIENRNTAVSSSLNLLNSVSDIMLDSNCTSNTHSIQSRYAPRQRKRPQRNNTHTSMPAST